MTDTDEKPMKALFDHCVTVFEEMFKEAVPEETAVRNYDGGPAMDQPNIEIEPSGYMIWTGHTTQLFARLGMATPYYTTVMRALKKMGCVEQVRRGGGNAQSKWRLVRRPEEEFFHAAELLKMPVQGTQKALEQQMRDMNSRLSALEGQWHDFVQAGIASVE
jgi:hypothetical protein